MKLREIHEAVKEENKKDKMAAKQMPEKPVEKPAEKRAVKREPKEEPDVSKGELIGKHYDALVSKRHAKAKAIVAEAEELYGAKWSEMMERKNKDFVLSEKG